jgi:hypothetical protein
MGGTGLILIINAMVIQMYEEGFSVKALPSLMNIE